MGSYPAQVGTEVWMMDCKRCEENLIDYIDGTQQKDFRHEMDTHVQDCPECREKLHEMRGLVRRLGDMEQERLPDSFTFEMRRALIAESEREHGWVSRFRAMMKPNPQTVWAAAVGTVAATVVLFMVSSFGSLNTNTVPGVAGQTEQKETKALVQDPQPAVTLEGEIIQVNADQDTVQDASQAETDVITVSAEF